MGSNKKHKIKKYQECDDYEDDDDDDESDENDDVDKNRMIYGKNRLRKNFFFFILIGEFDRMEPETGQWERREREKSYKLFIVSKQKE